MRYVQKPNSTKTESSNLIPPPDTSPHDDVPQKYEHKKDSSHNIIDAVRKIDSVQVDDREEPSFETLPQTPPQPLPDPAPPTQTTTNITYLVTQTQSEQKKSVLQPEYKPVDSKKKPQKKKIIGQKQLPLADSNTDLQKKLTGLIYF
jgi:hypothetical protein